MRELEERVKKVNISEIILATNPVGRDATALY
jgi:recombinational DNA repair protein RecR